MTKYTATDAAGHTCTVRFATGTCGKAAVFATRADDGTLFAECAECAAHPAAMAKAVAGVVHYGHKVGDKVLVHRYGRKYEATVTHVGARGAVYATFMYGNGAERTVRV